MTTELRDRALGLSALLVLPLVVVIEGGVVLFRSPGSLELNAAAMLPRRWGPVFDSEGRLLALDRPRSEGRFRRRVRGRDPLPVLPELRVLDPEPAHHYRLRLELERSLGLESHSGEALFDLVVSAIARFGLV